jgi:UPF0716 family protein affecting phage T7 exclusion
MVGVALAMMGFSAINFAIGMSLLGERGVQNRARIREMLNQTASSPSESEHGKR